MFPKKLFGAYTLILLMQLSCIHFGELMHSFFYFVYKVSLLTQVHISKKLKTGTTEELVEEISFQLFTRYVKKTEQLIHFLPY